MNNPLKHLKEPPMGSLNLSLEGFEMALIRVWNCISKPATSLVGRRSFAINLYAHVLVNLT